MKPSKDCDVTGRYEHLNLNVTDPALRAFASELLSLAPSHRGEPWVVERIAAAIKRQYCGVARGEPEVAAMEDLAAQIVQSASGDGRNRATHSA